MKRLVILLLAFSFFTISSCQKEDTIMTANATLNIPGISTLCWCCSNIYYEIDGTKNSVGTNLFRSASLPPGLSEPTIHPYSARVLIKYKKDTQTTCYGDYITVSEITFIQ